METEFVIVNLSEITISENSFVFKNKLNLPKRINKINLPHDKDSCWLPFLFPQIKKA